MSSQFRILSLVLLLILGLAVIRALGWFGRSKDSPLISEHSAAADVDTSDYLPEGASGYLSPGDRGVSENSARPSIARASIESPSVPAMWYEGASGYESAERLHRESKTPMFVYFYTDWCPYCKRVESDLLPSPEVSEFLKAVIKVKINPENGPADMAVANSYGVHGYPSIFVVPRQSESSIKIYPFRRVGDTFEALPASDFIAECRSAGGL